MPRRSDARSIDIVAAAALAACTLLSLSNLPAEELPPRWLLTWTVPAALLGLLFNVTRTLWQRAALAVILQGAAIWIALYLGPPLSRPAALACTILPPMAFVVARRQESDVPLGLFLSFCVLLVGIILDGVKLPLIAAYGAVACLCLRCEAHDAAVLAAHTRRDINDKVPRARTVVLTGLLVAMPCLLAAFAIERVLMILPSPAGPGRSVVADAPQPTDRRGTGLSDSFQLDGGQGPLSNLHGEQLVRATMPNAAAVPSGLYLRSSFFATPGLDRWQIGALDTKPTGSGFELQLRRPTPMLPVVHIELERYAGARNFVFAPPGACEVRGLEGVLADLDREWLRPANRVTADLYEVGYQNLAALANDTPIDPRGAQLGLLSLPADLDRTPYENLLEKWHASGTPAQIAERIAEGLDLLCRYDRQEPRGPYAHALENFLFAAKDRHGYCMHFASAAALMLRMRGVPCRIGVGLYGGDVDPRDATARLFGSQNAHAWVEIPFAGLGYVVFDPTPAAERGARMQSTLVEADTPDLTPSRTASDDNLRENLVAFATQPWLLGLLLVLAIAFYLRPRSAFPSDQPATPITAKTARRLLVRILRSLADAGLGRQRGQTLELFSRALAARNRLEPEVQSAFRVYQEVRFGGRVFDRDREQVMLRGLMVATAMPHEAAATPDAPAGG